MLLRCSEYLLFYSNRIHLFSRICPSCAPETKDRESYLVNPRGNSERIKCAVQSHLFLDYVVVVRTVLG